MISIEINNLSKSYKNGLKKTNVIEDFTTFINSDKCNFLIGYNGSGKSTLIKCILNHVDYKGNINVSSKKISYSPEKIILPDYITAYDFLMDLALSKNVDKVNAKMLIEYYLERFKMTEHQNKYLISLSKGTKQKINLIQSLIGESDIYIFDEPMSGLDEDAKNVFIEEVKKLRKHSKLIVISTHHLQDYRFKIKNIIDMGDKNV